MNKEELLAEAKRRYPVGCKVNQKNAYKGFGNIYTINSNNVNSEVDGEGHINITIDDCGVYNSKNGKWAEIIENKIENMNDLDRELKERENKLEQSTVNVKWNVVFPEIGAKEVYRTSNNKIKPNLIKHNNSRFQKLLIIRTNKSKHSGKTK